MRYLWVVCLSVGISFAEETVYLKNGKFQKGSVVAQSEEALTFEFKKAGVAGKSRVRIPWRSIDRIEFGTSLRQIDALKNPAGTDISVFIELWKTAAPWISRPESKAAAIGLAYAQKLLDLQEEMSSEEALDLYDHISKAAWNPQDQAAGIRGRLKTLLKSGRERDAIREAEELAAATENPALLLEAKYVLATDCLEKLKALEEENPRWFLDDEVRPARNELFNDAVDHSLFAYLFFGSEETAAAKGLYTAAEVYEFAGDLKNAQLCAGDIEKLYSGTKYAEQARILISKIQKQSTE
ncbi:MAG: hypothetical protein P1V20_19810 [Verrucomicrobiales bacterium]|nr:hypothetical protein [Verrucomicrobiales bacterium]